jgi:hypothetical protein
LDITDSLGVVEVDLDIHLVLFPTMDLDPQMEQVGRLIELPLKMVNLVAQIQAEEEVHHLHQIQVSLIIQVVVPVVRVLW